MSDNLSLVTRRVLCRTMIACAITLLATACAALLDIGDVSVTPVGDASADGPRVEAGLLDAGDAQVGSYASEVMKDFPLAYWRLDDVDAEAIDQSPHQKNGTYGPLVAHVAGLINDPDNDMAAFFRGAPDAATAVEGVIVSRDPIFEQQPATLTIEAWAQRLATPGDNSTGALVSYGPTNAPPDQPWVLQISPPNAQFYAANNDNLLSDASIVNGTTYYLVATFDRGRMRIYIDGALDIEGGIVGNQLSNYDNVTGLGIGSAAHGELPFKGIIDEVAVYDHVLTQDRILAHYNAGKK